MVGEILRKKREELGQDLRSISNDLKIRYDYLKAIEEEDLTKLPAQVYAKGYIQEYAKVLKLDPGTILTAYSQQTVTASPDSEETPKAPRGFRRGYLAIPLVLFLVAVVFAFVQQRMPEKEIVPLPVSQPVVPQPAIVETAENAVVESTVEEDAVVENAAEEAAPVPPVPADLVLKGTATETTWLVIVIDETHARELMMQPGESITWQAKKSFALKIGNAGGIRLVFNGKEIPDLGEKGEVRRITFPGSAG